MLSRAKVFNIDTNKNQISILDFRSTAIMSCDTEEYNGTENSAFAITGQE